VSIVDNVAQSIVWGVRLLTGSYVCMLVWFVFVLVLPGTPQQAMAMHRELEPVVFVASLLFVMRMLLFVAGFTGWLR